MSILSNILRGAFICGLLAHAALAVPVVFIQQSDPAGFFYSCVTNETGIGLSTITAPGVTQGYHFAGWTLNGVSQRDAVGRLANPAAFTLLEAMTATAHFRPANEDSNANRIPDWWEVTFRTNLIQDVSVDVDADGWNWRDEYLRDTHPALTDEVTAGGISFHYTAAATIISDPNLVSFRLSSIPDGLLVGRFMVTNRTQAAVLPDAFGRTTNGYRFAFWQVNGSILTDRLGRALSGASLVLESNTVAQAVFLLENEDRDSDRIPDWYEYNFNQGMGETPDQDADGDGFTLLEEYRRDTHPHQADEMMAGGVSFRFTAPISLITAAHLARFVQGSVPDGLVPAIDSITNRGTMFHLPDMFGEDTNGYRFACWTINGVVQTDSTGRALGGLDIVLTSNIEAQALFVPIREDANTNGVPDWYELNFESHLEEDADIDLDGDGLSLLEEYKRDSHPGLSDQWIAGGVSLSYSPASQVLTDTNLAGFSMGSVPPDLLASTGWVTDKNSSISLPDVFGVTNGYRFVCWTLNGAVQTDRLGRALSGLTFTLLGNVAAQAIFLPAHEDADADGVADGYEGNFYGGLDMAADSDSDADGWSLLEEFRRDTHPLLPDRIQAGGLSLSYAQSVSVNFQFFPRVRQALVDGFPQDFFSAAPPATGTFGMAGHTAPALGDWDGDGDPDLFVGGLTGVVRVLENQGSPVMANWVEKTALFTSLSTAWTNLFRPVPALGDWDGDGADDLAVGGTGGALRVISSTAQLTHNQNPSVHYELNVGIGQVWPAFLEVSGDGRLDLLVLSTNGLVTVYTNTGLSALPFSAPPAADNLLGMAVPAATGMTTADVDDDGWNDVLISDSQGNIWEFRRTMEGGFSLRSKVYAGSYAGLANDLCLAAGDLDGDGDSDLLGGFSEGGLIYLRNPADHLVIAPPSLTLVAGDSFAFAVSNYAGAPVWSFITNRSGGSLQTVSGVYTSGPKSSVTDVLEARGGDGLAGRAYVNVIGSDDISSAGKAVIIAGGKSLSDPVWLATDHVADFAYNTLRFRGFSKANINYLSFGPADDVDGNGLDDDVDLAATLDHAALTFTNWVGNANKLFVFLADHGSDTAGQGYFRLNAGEHLTATNLDAWLDRIQDEYGTEVIVAMDFCYSGSFLDELTYTGTAARIVVASTASDELTYFIAGGLVSFSDVFLNALLQGFRVGESFLLGQDAMRVYQNATLDDNSDGVYQAGVDGTASVMRVGASFIVGRDCPQIGTVAPNRTITGDTAVVWASDVTSVYPLSRVWCSIIPPGHSPDEQAGNPVVDVPEVELTYTPSARRYEKELTGLSEPGTYRVAYSAQDIWGGVSRPRQSLITQTGVVEKAILVAGGSTADVQWAGIEFMAHNAFNTCRARRLDRDRICYLYPGGMADADGDGTNDVDDEASLEHLREAVTNWASDAQRLTVYVAGRSTNNIFQLNEMEPLTAADLDAWLDAWQTAGKTAQAIMEFSGSGGYIPDLLPPADRQRILVASTKAGAAGVWGARGIMSFSQYLMNALLSGHSLGEAFAIAKTAIRASSGRLNQTAQLDDDGDGVANEKNQDLLLANTRYLGSAFVTGDDVPTIGSVMSGCVLLPTNALLLWAGDLVDASGISNVWCMVTPPEYDGEGELPETNLAFNAAANRYEAVYAGLTNGGDYTLTFHALNNAGHISSPVQALAMVADVFEPDDTNAPAGYLDVGDAQSNRNFHAASDEDWIRFYVLSTGRFYDVRAVQYGTNVDVALDVYYERADGTLSNLYAGIDDAGPGSGEEEKVTLDFEADPSLPEGFYLARVYAADTNRWGLESGYAVSVIVPTGGGTLTVIAADKLNGGQSPPGAYVTVDGVNRGYFNGATSLGIALGAGSHTVEVPCPAGYIPEEDPQQANQVANADSALYGNPKNKKIQENRWQTAVFAFMPYARVSPETVARDRETGAWLEDVKVSFNVTGGALADRVYDKFPNTTYGVEWYTRPDGGFPTSVILPAVSSRMTLMKAGYSNLVRDEAIQNPAYGSLTNLSICWMIPVDANGNGMADSWEERYFGVGSNVVAGEDSDEDRFSNGEEYRLGTDPVDADSCLKHDRSPTAGTNGLIFIWPVASGRGYEMQAADDPAADSWMSVFGPREATNGQSDMSCTDTTAVWKAMRVYRLNAYYPQHE